ncbi:MAG: ABC transporter permease [Syntrophales bacterium]|jgi:putative ABC transport system permease protein|nr:ABC transporter permease [Syntrophales bacterium]NLN60008.1 ABC transporter permease [Deltaproteobacteria bacterium]
MLIVRLLFKNAFRHKFRAFLTILSITIAILAFVMLRTLVGAWHVGVDASSASRLVSRNAVSIIFPLPLSYKDRIRQIDGVRLVSYGNWFGGIYIDEKHFFANFAVEARTYLELYPEYVLPPKERDIFLKDRKACAAGKKLAAKYGWKIGDMITLRGTIYPGNWDFTLRAIYHGKTNSVDEAQFFFHWDYLNETMKKAAPSRADEVGFYMIGVKTPDLSGAISEAIDENFRNSWAETLTETEKAFQQGFIAMSGAIITAIEVVSFVVIIIMLAVVANTMAMTTRERIGEYAILKTLGFGAWAIGGLIAGESVIISLCGYCCGVILSFPAAMAFKQSLGMYFPVFKVETASLLMALGSSLTVAILASVVPVQRAIAIRIADGLRRIG